MTNIIKRHFRKMKGGVKFFVFILFLFVILFFINRDIAEQVFSNFIGMSKKIVPLLFFVFIIMVIVDMVFTKERTVKYFGKNSGIKSWIYAIIAGVLISGPPYILYPMLSEFKKKGMSDSLLAVFLFNRNVKIAFLPALIFYFGLEYAIVLSVYIIIFSVLNGLLVSKVLNYNK